MAASKDVTYLSTPIVEAYRDPPPIGTGMTREGYTKASGAPTDLMIRLDGEKKFRRLMIWQFSNMGTLFVRIGGKPHVVRQEDVPEAKPSEGPVALPRHRHHATRKYSEKASEKVARTLHEWKRGKLTSGSGGKVKSREQAIAIGLAQARAKGYKVPPSPSYATISAYEKNRLSTIELRPRILPEFLPLFDHLLKLAAHSHRVGYPQRAGIELRQARQLLRHGER